MKNANVIIIPNVTPTMMNLFLFTNLSSKNLVKNEMMHNLE